MTDHFALLNEPWRPWLDLEALKEKFIRLSAEAHPDRVHGASAEDKEQATRRYAGLNAAYNCLREPRERLLHLLELELGQKPRDIQRIPPGTMDLFVEVGQTCRDADAFLVQKDQVTSPLLKVKVFEQSQEWVEKLQALQQKINVRRDELFAELQSLNAAWKTAPEPGSSNRASALPLERLEQIYRTLSYVARWTAQLQERIVPLSF